MDHYKQMCLMLDSIPIKYTIDQEIMFGKRIDSKIEYTIEVWNNEGFGYSNHVSIWFFDDRGNLVTTGAYEV